MIRPFDWWIVDQAMRPDAPQRPAATSPLRRRERNLAARLLVSLVGGAVFIALLVACLWLAGLVMLKVALWARTEREP